MAEMNAQTPYELYRVITDYEALQDGFLDRIDDLDTTLQQIDLNAGFAGGNTQKLLTKNPGKAIKRPRDHRTASARRTFGWESLGKMLKGTGLALVLVVDDERFAPMKEQLMKRKRPRQPANAGSKRPTWLFTKNKAREMGRKRFSLMTEAERKRHQRKAGKASARARRRKAEHAAMIVDTAIDQSINKIAPACGALNKSRSSGIA
jgi:hypothetical protein